jgi:hypothetical protein
MGFLFTYSRTASGLHGLCIAATNRPFAIRARHGDGAEVLVQLGVIKLELLGMLNTIGRAASRAVNHDKRFNTLVECARFPQMFSLIPMP